MNRRNVVLALAAFTAAPQAIHAQQPGRIFRIGTLSAGREPDPKSRAELLDELRKLGWIEGKNVIFERRWADDDLSRLPVLAAELVRLKVDVIYTVGTLAPLAAKRATSTIPIVMAAAGDPLGSGLVASLARPGGNVTGMSMMVPDMGGKRLQILKELLPNATRFAIVWNSTNPYSTNAFKSTQAAAKSLEVALQSLELRSLEDFKSAAESALRGRAEALLVVEDPLTVDLRKQLANFAATNRLPALYGIEVFVDAGGLMSYGVSYDDLRHRGVGYLDKILKGAKPGDLPIEQPTKFELVISLKTARAIGLTLPQSLLLRADRVIE